MLSDGRLVVYMNEGSNANAGTVYVLDPATGGRTQLWGDSIANVPGNPQATDYWQTNEVQMHWQSDIQELLYTMRAQTMQGHLLRRLLCCLGRQCFKTVWRANERRCVIEYGCTTRTSFGYMGDIDPATITSKTVGLQFLNENRGSNLYGVSEDGQFFRIIKKGHGGQPPTDVQVDDVVDFGTILGGRQLGGPQGPSILRVVDLLVRSSL